MAQDVERGVNYTFDHGPGGGSATYSVESGTWSYQFPSGNVRNHDGSWSYNVSGDDSGFVTVRTEPDNGWGKDNE